MVQENHYDPLALDLAGLNKQPGSTASRFTYNSNEQQQGLGWLDYGARMYDPSIGRWNGVEPLAEKNNNTSVFTYTINNPILLTDLFGLDNVNVNEKKSLFTKMM